MCSLCSFHSLLPALIASSYFCATPSQQWAEVGGVTFASGGANAARRAAGAGGGGCETRHRSRDRGSRDAHTLSTRHTSYAGGLLPRGGPRCAGSGGGRPLPGRAAQVRLGSTAAGGDTAGAALAVYPRRPSPPPCLQGRAPRRAQAAPQPPRDRPEASWGPGEAACAAQHLGRPCVSGWGVSEPLSASPTITGAQCAMRHARWAPGATACHRRRRRPLTNPIVRSPSTQGGRGRRQRRL